MADKGILSFIKMKLEHGVTPQDIHDMLRRAGFHDAHIDNGFNEVKRVFNDTHQDIVAQNDFLPPLQKTASGDADYMGVKQTGDRAQRQRDNHLYDECKGLFAGRLRRKDFVLGFLFFFGLGYIAIALASLMLAQFAPTIWNAILTSIESDSDNMLLMIVPVILFPITIMMLSLIARRLHNLGLPGGIALMFLIWFMPSFKMINPTGEIALQIALAILFIVLVTVKGNPVPNMYGPFPKSNGSFFKKIFNL